MDKGANYLIGDNLLTNGQNEGTLTFYWEEKGAAHNLSPFLITPEKLSGVKTPY